MSEITFKELKRIEAEQKKIWAQQDEQLKNQAKGLELRSKELDQRQIRMNDAQRSDMERKINQSLDFALKALPWWRRSTKNVLNKSLEYFEVVEVETKRRMIIKMAEKNIEPKINNE